MTPDWLWRWLLTPVYRYWYWAGIVATVALGAALSWALDGLGMSGGPW